MKKLALAGILSAAMMMAAITPAFAESAPEAATESTATAEDGLNFEQAVDIALADAGLTSEDVTFSKKMHTYEDGTEVYEIKFVIPGETKYEYVIDDKTGTIREKEAEPWEAEDDADFSALISADQKLFDFEAAENQIVTMPAANTVVEECAKDRQADLVYYQYGMEYDDGRIVYDLYAMFPQEAKFEYKFDMNTGDVVSLEKEGWEAEDNFEYQEILENHGLSAK